MEIVATRIWKNQQKKKQFTQLNETLIDVTNGNGTNVNVIENETLEQQTKGQHIGFEKFHDSASQNQVVEIIFDNKDRRVLNNAISTVENRMEDAFSTAMDKMIIPRVEMTVKSITGSSRHGPISEVQNLDRKDLLGNAGNTPLKLGSRRLDLNTNQDRKDEIRNEENFEDGDFLGIRTFL